MKSNVLDHHIEINELSSKADILKQYENHCFQVCYYLLHCEKKAFEASLASIEHLFSDTNFFCKEEVDQLKAVRKTAMHYSLAMLH